MLRRFFLLRKHVDQGGDLVRLESVTEWGHILPSVVNLLFDGVLLQPLANRKQGGSLAWDADAADPVTVLAAFFMKQKRARRRVDQRSMHQSRRRLHRIACEEHQSKSKGHGQRRLGRENFLHPAYCLSS